MSLVLRILYVVLRNTHHRREIMGLEISSLRDFEAL